MTIERRMPHYIRQNHAAHVPRRVMVFDTEARRLITTTGEVQTWRCGVVVYCRWTNKGVLHKDTVYYTDAATMWKEMVAFTRPKQRTVAYAHNLPYDLRVGNAFVHLPAAGARLAAIRLASQGAWSRWDCQGRTLILADSASLFPCPLATLAKTIGAQKTPLPDGDSPAEWERHCRRDAEILAAIIVQYMEWLRTGVAGNWQLTGAGQSWAHWRHSFYDKPVFVHSDDGALAAEREAMYAGRAEAWQWGLRPKEDAYEWDWQNAYPRIVRDVPMPTKYVGTSVGGPVSQLWAMAHRGTVLADVTVTTELPLVPTRHEGRIMWPVGTFRSTLWDPEVRLLYEYGATVKVHRIWMYRSTDALKAWGTEMLDGLSGRRPAEVGWQLILYKHWSRALIGRFATQYQNWEPFGHEVRPDVKAGHFYDADADTLSEFIQVGNDVHTLAGVVESDDSCPQITSYVMSVARAKLWDAMHAVGTEHVLYVDTDSLVLTRAGHRRMQQLIAKGLFPGLRLKSEHRGVEIFGPRAAVFGDTVKMSGIPRNAQRTDDDAWVGEIWTQLDTAIRTGEHDRVTVTRRRFRNKWNEKRRARVCDGTTAAWRLPTGQPERDTGRIDPTTDREKLAHVTRQLSAHEISTHGRY
jgi:hypothetical protein